MNHQIRQIIFGSLLLFSCVICAQAQEHEYVLKGKFQLANSTQKDYYQLVFTESGGHIKGYSLTGHGTPDERKALIEGTIDTQKGTYEFRETKIEFLSRVYDLSCLGYGWGYFRNDRGLAWTKGYMQFYSPARCARLKGEFRLNPDDELNYRLTGFNPSGPRLLQRKPAAPLQLPDSMMDEEVQELSTANPLELNWTSNKLYLMLMDDKEEDGDQLSVLLNGEALVREQPLTKKEYIIEAPLQPGRNVLTLHAENEGSLPPNTARILLWNGQQRYVVHSVINAWREAQIEIMVPE